MSALGYAYVTESVLQPLDGTAHQLGNLCDQMIKKIQISSTQLGRDVVDLLVRGLIDNYTDNGAVKGIASGETRRDIERRSHDENHPISEKSLHLLSSDLAHATLPTAVTETMEAFVSSSGICSLQCISSVCAYSDSNNSRLRVRSLSTSPVASCSVTHSEPYEILLVTGCSYDSASGETSAALSDVRVLDSSLVTLAVLGMGNLNAFSDTASSTDHRQDDLSVSMPLCRLSEGVEAMNASQPKAASLDMHTEVVAINAITSACLVPAVCAPQSASSEKRGNLAVALVTAYSKECPVLSNKLLFWHPVIGSGNMSGMSSPIESVFSRSHSHSHSHSHGHSHSQVSLDILTAALAASSDDLPFVNMLALAISGTGTGTGTGGKKEAQGSRGTHMLTCTSRMGRHQYLVLGDMNGHVWGTAIGTHSDFPGPMYPPGFTLMQRVESYIEREDELDNVLASTSAAEGPPLAGSKEDSTGLSDLQPFIDVGVSPYYIHNPASVFLTAFNRPCTDNTVISRFCHRLPLRLLGGARDALLERKAKALLLKKASMARVRAPSTASKKRCASTRGGNSRSNKKKKKKMPLALILENKDLNSTDDDCTASDPCTFLPLLASSSFPDGASVHEELVVSVASPSPSLPQGCTGNDTDTGGLDVVDGSENASSLTKIFSGSSNDEDKDRDRDGDKDKDRGLQHEDSEDSESDNESAPASKPPSQPINAEDQSALVPVPVPVSSLALSDVLPVPRRVLTGDFAVRLSKAKEVN